MDFQQSGGKVVYSIDTDIFYLYIDPVGTERYTHVFESDSAGLRTALAKRIPEFIFHSLRDKVPITILPPHQREVANMFFELGASAGTEQGNVQKELDELSESISAVQEELRVAETDADRVDILLRHTPSLRNFLFGFDSPSVKLSRLADLLDRIRLQAIDELTDSRLEAVSEYLSLPRTIADFIDYDLLCDAWEGRLRDTKPEDVREQALVADCEALARVELLNQAASDLRVLHITGDQAVFRAARDYTLSAHDQSFADLCLRDPRCFLAEPEVLFPEEKRGSHSRNELMNWLDVFLDNFGTQPDLARSALEKKAVLESNMYDALGRDVQTRYADAVRDFDEGWVRFSEAVVLDSSDVTRGEGSPLDQLVDVLGEDQGIGLAAADFGRSLARVLGDLKKIVDDRVDETWRNCFDAATRVGFQLVQPLDGETLPARYPPPIMFDGFADVAEFFSRMLRNAGSYGHEQIIETFANADSYVFYLVFGGLFGAQGKWLTAAMLAGRAIATVKSGSRTVREERITGREAYYLRSIARRLTARSVEDLRNARQDLEAAQRALESDRRRGGAKSVTSLRFDAEEIAFRMSRYLLMRFGDAADGSVGELGDWRGDVAKLLDRVDDELEDDSVRERVRVALLVNYLMAAMTSMQGKEGCSEDDGKETDVLKELREMSRREHIGGDSYLVRAVVLAAGAVYESPKGGGRRRAVAAIKEHFADWRSNVITVYDEARFRYLRDLALEYLVDQ